MDNQIQNVFTMENVHKDRIESKQEFSCEAVETKNEIEYDDKNTKKLTYRISDIPPIHLALFFAFQVRQ